jgi:pSer/pThr/pTyr-binding forkhead associated (FHA) protein
MTTQAPPRSPQQAEVLAPGHAETAPLTTRDTEPILDSFRFLDYRAQRRAISDRVAPAGQFLAFLDGEETKLVKLESTITHLGRSLTSDVRFEDQRVSRTHAIIARHGRFARLLDNRSANGTFLNGRPVMAASVCHGDVIRVGPLAMQYLDIR